MVVTKDSRTVFDAISREHERLAGRFEQIRVLLHQRQTNPPGVLHLLSELALVVERHFAHEERGGYFREVVEMAPQLLTAVDALRRQHDALLRRLRDMCGHVRLAHDSWVWWQAIRIDFEGFTRQFIEHESRENSLAQDAYMQDIGPSD